MSRQAPREIADLAIARATAREARDWATADRLKAGIEAAGWTVVDRGTRYTLRPAHLPDVEDDGTVRYGHSLGVPSRWGEPASAKVSVVLVVDDRNVATDDVLAALVAADDGTGPLQVIVVADDPTPAQASVLAGYPAVGRGSGDEGSDLAPAVPGTVGPEVVWTSGRLGRPVALNAGLRRVVGSTVIVVGADVDWRPGAVAGLTRALDDPAVAIVGLRGLVTADLRRFRDVEAGPATVVTGTIAFRRDDLIARGPLEERFLTARGLDAWWSLVLRDAADPVQARHALVVPAADDGVGAGGGSGGGSTGRPVGGPVPDEASRPVRRDFYRLRDAFGDRGDLLAGEPSAEARPAD
jgi:hypothetical protein